MALLNKLKSIIISVSKPYKIILFGFHAASNSIKNVSGVPATFQYYDLLVIVRNCNPKDLLELQTLMENICLNHGPVNIILHTIDQINGALQTGNYFLCQLIEHGVPLYDNTPGPLSPASKTDFVQTKETATYNFRQWSDQAKAFSKCAKFSLVHKYDRTCAFLLHQAVEQMYQAIILTHAGYKPITRNLGKLKRSIAHWAIKAALVFPDETSQDRKLFNILVAAYKEARYDTEFHILKKDLEELAGRVDRLIDLGEAACLKYLDLLTSLSAQDTS